MQGLLLKAHELEEGAAASERRGGERQELLADGGTEPAGRSDLVDESGVGRSGVERVEVSWSWFCWPVMAFTFVIVVADIDLQLGVDRLAGDVGLMVAMT